MKQFYHMDAITLPLYMAQSRKITDLLAFSQLPDGKVLGSNNQNSNQRKCNTKEMIAMGMKLFRLVQAPSFPTISGFSTDIKQQLIVLHNRNWEALMVNMMHLLLHSLDSSYSSCIGSFISRSYCSVHPFIYLGHIIGFLCCSSCFLFVKQRKTKLITKIESS